MTPEQETRLDEIDARLPEAKDRAPTGVLAHVIFADVPWLSAKLREANAIVDKLPKYADTGGPIVPGTDPVWLIGNHWMGDDPVCQDDSVEAILVAWWGDHAAVMISGATECDHWDGPMYSTREAAEAAQEQTNG